MADRQLGRRTEELGPFGTDSKKEIVLGKQGITDGAQDRRDSLETARKLAELALKQQGKPVTDAGIAKTLSDQRGQQADVRRDDRPAR